MYDRETRQTALDVMDAMGGEPTQQVAKRLGLPLTTLRRWARERAAGKEPVRSSTREVRSREPLENHSRTELIARVQELEVQNAVLERRVETLERQAGLE